MGLQIINGTTGNLFKILQIILTIVMIITILFIAPIRSEIQELGQRICDIQLNVRQTQLQSRQHTLRNFIILQKLQKIENDIQYIRRKFQN